MEFDKLWADWQPLIIKHGIDVIAAIILLLVGLWLAKLISRLIGKGMDRAEMDKTLVNFVTALVRTGLIIFIVIATIAQVGIETSSFVAVLAAAGFAVGMALQGSLSNFAAGVMLIIFRPFKIGQFIEGGGAAGTVENIGIFVTTLNTPDYKVVYIPNSKLFGDTITNYSVKSIRRVDMVFGIGYGDDIDHAKKVIADILKADERVLEDPAPAIAVAELADSSVNFNVRPWVKSADYWGVYLDTTEAVKKKFDENKISIPFPQTDVHLSKD